MADDPETKTQEYLDAMLQRKLWAAAYQCALLLTQVIQDRYFAALLASGFAERGAYQQHVKRSKPC